MIPVTVTNHRYLNQANSALSSAYKRKILVNNCVKMIVLPVRLVQERGLASIIMTTYRVKIQQVSRSHVISTRFMILCSAPHLAVIVKPIIGRVISSVVDRSRKKKPVLLTVPGDILAH